MIYLLHRKNISWTSYKIINVNSLEKSSQINFVKKDENKEIFDHTKFNQAILNSNEKTRKINYFNIIKSYFCFKDEKYNYKSIS